MPRVKRSVHARKKRRKVLEQAKGYWGLKSTNYTYAKEQVEHSLVYAYRDRKNRKRDVPAALDHPHQRRRARARALVQPVHLGPEGRERRARPQGARRPRGERSGGVRQARRAGQVRAGCLSQPGRLTLDRQREIFLRQAEYCDSRSPLYAALCRRFADDERVAAIAPDLRWDFPLRLLGALHYLVLGGEALVGRRRRGARRARRVPRPLRGRAAGADERGRAGLGAAARAASRSATERARPARARRERRAAARGSTATRYRYGAGPWGDGAAACSTGDERGGRPPELLARRLRIARRRGIDRDPIDVTSDEGERLLEAFVWPDQDDAARAAARGDRDGARRPARARSRGDYVDGCRAARSIGEPTRSRSSRAGLDACTSTTSAATLRASLAAAGEAPLAGSRSRARAARRATTTALELELWPGGSALARARRLPRRWHGVGRVITSRDNEKLKLVRKLHERRWREKLGLFVCEGEDLVEAATADAGRAARRGRERRAAAARRGLDARRTRRA